jgi:hypothetical protein
MLYPTGVCAQRYSGAGYDDRVAELRGATPPLAAARMLLLIALLGGIVTMHAVTVTLGHEPAHSTPMTVEHHTMGGASAAGGHADSADESCRGDHCHQQHAGLHGCVFILTAISFVAGLALLCWVGITRAALIAPQLRRGCRHRQRAPPWTVLTHAELSIFRI